MPTISGMRLDPRGGIAERAMQVAEAYESFRGAHSVRTDKGYDAELQAALRSRWGVRPWPPSADLLSEHELGTRIIEVKGRALSGPPTVYERERYTFEVGGEDSWLYVAWNMRQREGEPPERLLLVQDPFHLPWTKTREASRPPGTYRGVQHEAQFQCDQDALEELGVEIDLSSILVS